MENRNYTVEQWIPSKMPDRVCYLVTSAGWPKKPYLNQDGIKRGGVAHVSKFF
jgi:hypothetical protein